MAAYPDDVPRPKTQRPEPVADPDLGAGQADRLRRARIAKGYSLHDLAAGSRVAAKTILGIEKGTATPTCVTMARLADALGVPRGWLAFGG